jgi:hypothetical protein
MNVLRWVLAVVYVLLITYGLVMLLEPGSQIELGVIAGAVLSLVLSYAPGVAKVYETLEPEAKQAVNIGLMVLVAAMIFGLSCAALLNVGVTCTVQSALDLLLLLAVGLISNQGIYSSNKYLAAKVFRK